MQNGTLVSPQVTALQYMNMNGSGEAKFYRATITNNRFPARDLRGALEGGDLLHPTQLHTGHSWMPLTSLLFWLSVYRPCRVLR